MSPRISTRLLATQSDERLVALVREGHERAFEALVHRYRRPLLHYTRRMVVSEARAEDVLQQTLMRAWLALRNGTEVRDLKPWLYRIAHNTAINAIRNPAAEHRTLNEAAQQAAEERGALAQASERSIDQVLAARDALAGMAALPPMQREVMVRTAVGGHSHEEVASALGITDGAVRGLLYRARATLRSAVTAVTPPPLIGWLVNEATNAGLSCERVAELASGGSGPEIGETLMRGGAVMAAAGAVVAGASLTPRAHRASPHRPAAIASLARPHHPGVPHLEAGLAGTPGLTGDRPRTPAPAGRAAHRRTAHRHPAGERLAHHPLPAPSVVAPPGGAGHPRHREPAVRRVPPARPVLTGSSHAVPQIPAPPPSIPARPPTVGSPPAAKAMPAREPRIAPPSADIQTGGHAIASSGTATRSPSARRANTSTGSPTHPATGTPGSQQPRSATSGSADQPQRGGGAPQFGGQRQGGGGGSQFGGQAGGGGGTSQFGGQQQGGGGTSPQFSGQPGGGGGTSPQFSGQPGGGGGTSQFGGQRQGGGGGSQFGGQRQGGGGGSQFGGQAG
ncbi:MAG: sigma-70 family RNA polymerase sigma factor, partial [Solirubrobacterales bacterium]|nr:sigma-70 family RNA polymerase sigma factor [Solirubrobacterales bacterium]